MTTIMEPLLPKKMESFVAGHFQPADTKKAPKFSPRGFVGGSDCDVYLHNFHSPSVKRGKVKIAVAGKRV
jgi:hypothetical protein